MYEVGRCLLRYRLKEAHMTQQELAEATGKTKSQISDYIHNRFTMSMKTAKTLAVVLKCNIDDLYEWTYIGK